MKHEHLCGMQMPLAIDKECIVNQNTCCARGNELRNGCHSGEKFIQTDRQILTGWPFCSGGGFLFLFSSKEREVTAQKQLASYGFALRLMS